MKVTTDGGKTFTVDWLVGPLSGTNAVMMQFHDPRPLSEIAADVDGVKRFVQHDDAGEDVDYDGYTRLMSIVRARNGGKDTVRIAVEQEEG